MSATEVEREVFGVAAVPDALVGFDELYQQQWWPMLRLATGLVVGQLATVETDGTIVFEVAKTPPD